MTVPDLEEIKTIKDFQKEPLTKYEILVLSIPILLSCILIAFILFVF